MTRKVGLGLAALLLTSLLTVAPPVSAAVFDFSYMAIDGTFSGHGEFTTASLGSPYMVSDVTGIANVGDIGSSITGISSYANADNLLYFPTSTSSTLSFVSGRGISFTTASDGDFNLYFNDLEFTGYGRISSSLDSSGNGPGTQVQFSVSATPLPAALPLFATGLGVTALLAAWRRKRKNDVAIAPFSVEAVAG